MLPFVKRTSSGNQQNPSFSIDNMHRRGIIWKSIKRRGKDGISTAASAASTVEESVSCDSLAPKPQGDDDFYSHTDLQEFRLELIERASSVAKDSAPVDVDDFFVEPQVFPIVSSPNERQQDAYSGEEDLCEIFDSISSPQQQEYHHGPVDVDTIFMEDDNMSTSTTSEERADIWAIQTRLQSRSEKVPQTVVLVDNDDDYYDSCLAGYEEGFGTLFDDIYHAPTSCPFDDAYPDSCSYPFDEMAGEEYYESVSSKNQSRSYVNKPSLGRMAGLGNNAFSKVPQSLDSHTVSSKKSTKSVLFEC